MRPPRTVFYVVAALLVAAAMFAMVFRGISNTTAVQSVQERQARQAALQAEETRFERELLAGVQKLLDRPTETRVTIKTSAGTQTFTITRTVNRTVVRCVRPSGKPC